MNMPEQPRRFSAESGSRVVALINPMRHCRATCATLIERGVNLVGIVEARTKRGGLPLATFRRLLKKQGLLPTTSRVAARLAYLAKNRNRDRELYDQLFDSQQIDQTLATRNAPVISCTDYAAADTIASIKNLQPDILVVHSQCWVTARVRALAAKGLVIGGHPGITPHYRGSHSSFWALLQGQPDMIGWTAFHVDQGVDSGAVIMQGRLTAEADDSYMTLNWRGMKKIAEAQAAAILEFDRTGSIPRFPHRQIPPNSEFGLPGLRDYLRYRRVQKLVR